MSTVYSIARYSAQISVKRERDLDKLVPGCALDDTDPEGLGLYSTEEEAREAYKAYTPSIYFTDSIYGGQLALVTEYGLESFETDGDGEYFETNWIDTYGFPSEISWNGSDYNYDIRARRWVCVDEEARHV